MKIVTTLRGNWTDGPCYYVSVRDGKRWALLVGPFAHQRQAAAAVEVTRRASERVDPRAIWYEFGTCRCLNGYREGSLNQDIGFDGMPHQPKQYVRRLEGQYGF